MKHLIVDFRVPKALEQVLWDADYLASMLLRLVRFVGMRPLMDHPLMFKESDGVTGFIVIATSHISIHTWPLDDGRAYMDIFSCNDFDQDEVRKFLDGYFKPFRCKIIEVNRWPLKRRIP
jgi:S-adenosylmethionine/arginine decarboxylase-like enzyme